MDNTCSKDETSKRPGHRSSPKGANSEVFVGDSEQMLLQGSARLPLLNPAQHVALAKRAERGDAAAKNLFIESNQRLAISIAKRYLGRGLTLAELSQEGMIGLIRAVELWDWRRGYRFSTYATWWIEQAVRRAVEDQGRPIRIPHNVAEAMNKVERAERRLVVRLGRTPTSVEIAEETGLTADRVTELQDYAAQGFIASLDRPLSADAGAATLGDLLPDSASPSPHDLAVAAGNRAALAEPLSDLTFRERMVAELRFGLGGQAPATLDEVADITGMPVDRVRLTEATLLERLADHAEDLAA